MDKILFPKFPASSRPKISIRSVRHHLSKIKVNKSNSPGDIPAKVIKEFASFLCVPPSDIINCSLKSGIWPRIYKREYITPIPRQYPTETKKMLRPISILFNFNKIFTKIISKMVISDMKIKMDPQLFANQKNLGINHYLVRLLH